MHSKQIINNTKIIKLKGNTKKLSLKREVMMIINNFFFIEKCQLQVEPSIKPQSLKPSLKNLILNPY